MFVHQDHRIKVKVTGLKRLYTHLCLTCVQLKGSLVLAHSVS